MQKHSPLNQQFSSIWPIDRTLSDATTPGQSLPGSDGNEGVIRISQSSSITGISLSDYPSAETQSAHSIGPEIYLIAYFSLLYDIKKTTSYLILKFDTFVKCLIMISTIYVMSRDGSRRRGGGNDTLPPLN